MKRDYRAFLAAFCAFLIGCAFGQYTNTTEGTLFSDDLTSRSRVVVDAFLNSSNRVHALIQKVSPAPDLSGYATTGAVAKVASSTNDFVRVDSFTNDVSFVVTGKWSHVFSEWHFWLDDAISEDYSLSFSDGIWKLYLQGQEYGNSNGEGNETEIIFDENSTWEGEHSGYTLTCRRYPVPANPLNLASKSDIPTNNLQLANGAGYVTGTITNGLAAIEDIVNGDIYIPKAYEADNASFAYSADYANDANNATFAYDLKDPLTDERRTSATIFSQIDNSATKQEVELHNKHGNTPGEWTLIGVPENVGVYGPEPNNDYWMIDFTTTNGVYVGNAPGGEDATHLNFTCVNTTNESDRITVVANRDFLPNYGYSIGTNNIVFIATNSDKWVQLSTITTNSTSGDGIAYTLGERAAGVNYGQNSLTQGRNNSAAGLWSVAMGDNNAARLKGTMALGVKSLSSNTFAYVWSGIDSSGVTPRYGSHGIGSYNVNPVGDVYGFWIGERNLYDIFRHFATNEANVTITRNIGDEEDPIEAVEVAPAMPLVKKSEFNSVASSVNAMWSTLYGESVWIAVTNYMRQIAGTVPSLRLWEVRDSNTNLVYSSAEEIEHVVTQKVNAAESRIMAAMPSTAWGAYQSSGVENPSPEDITVVNSPKIMLSSGYTWQKCIETGSASVWVLKANGIMNLGGGEGAETNGYFRITDAEGNAQFEVIKTSDQEVGAIATDTKFDSSNNFTIRYNSSSSSHPTLYCALSLADDFDGEDANGDINNLGISVTWAQDGGTNWIATVHQDSPSSSLFCHAKMTIQGTNLIKNSAPSSFDGGIYINNTRYRLGTATISGHLVLTLETW